MVTRREILSEAIDKCLKDLYSQVQPKISWNHFKLECEQYSKKYLEWEDWRKTNKGHPEWEEKFITECIGPKPYEFYYLPKEIMKDICDSYVYAYKLDSQQEFLDTIEILKNYCKEPIVDKYIEGELRKDGTRWPGHRGYDHPDNLKTEIIKILGDIAIDNDYYQDAICNKFFEFLDMAGNFYNWNGELNSFNMSVYLGPSPNHNKQAVIDNWKKYRNKEIKINDDKYNKE